MKGGRTIFATLNWYCDIVAPLVLILRSSMRKANVFGYILKFKTFWFFAITLLTHKPRSILPIASLKL